MKPNDFGTNNHLRLALMLVPDVPPAKKAASKRLRRKWPGSA